MKADVTQLLGLVPELGGFSPEGRFCPGEEEAVLVDVVRGVVARDDLAGRRMERMDISASRVMGGVFPGLGGGFGQVAKDGFSTFAQPEPLIGRIKLEGIRRRFWFGFAVGRQHGDGKKGEPQQGLSKCSHTICNRFIMDG